MFSKLRRFNYNTKPSDASYTPWCEKFVARQARSSRKTLEELKRMYPPASSLTPRRTALRASGMPPRNRLYTSSHGTESNPAPNIESYTLGCEKFVARQARSSRKTLEELKRMYPPPASSLTPRRTPLRAFDMPPGNRLYTPVHGTESNPVPIIASYTPGCEKCAARQARSSPKTLDELKRMYPPPASSLTARRTPLRASGMPPGNGLYTPAHETASNRAPKIASHTHGCEKFVARQATSLRKTLEELKRMYPPASNLTPRRTPLRASGVPQGEVLFTPAHETESNNAPSASYTPGCEKFVTRQATSSHKTLKELKRMYPPALSLIARRTLLRASDMPLENELRTPAHETESNPSPKIASHTHGCEKFVARQATSARKTLEELKRMYPPAQSSIPRRTPLRVSDMPLENVLRTPANETESNPAPKIASHTHGCEKFVARQATSSRKTLEELKRLYPPAPSSIPKRTPLRASNIPLGNVLRTPAHETESNPSPKIASHTHGCEKFVARQATSSRKTLEELKRMYPPASSLTPRRTPLRASGVPRGEMLFTPAHENESNNAPSASYTPPSSIPGRTPLRASDMPLENELRTPAHVTESNPSPKIAYHTHGCEKFVARQATSSRKTLKELKRMYPPAPSSIPRRTPLRASDMPLENVLRTPTHETESNPSPKIACHTHGCEKFVTRQATSSRKTLEELKRMYPPPPSSIPRRTPSRASGNPRGEVLFTPAHEAESNPAPIIASSTPGCEKFVARQATSSRKTLEELKRMYPTPASTLKLKKTLLKPSGRLPGTVLFTPDHAIEENPALIIEKTI